VGQNSTQKPQALQRSTTIDTRPLATRAPGSVTTKFDCGGCDYGANSRVQGASGVTEQGEGEHDLIRGLRSVSSALYVSYRTCPKWTAADYGAQKHCG
jgi:hypothetical protein